MLQKFKKLTSILCCSGLLLSLMGCLSQTNTVSPKTTIIRFSSWGNSEEIQVTRALIRQFEVLHPQIHIELLHIPDNYYQKLHILIAGGLTPDVVFTNSLTFPVYASNGIFQDLNPYLQQSQILKRSQFFPQAVQSFTWEGKVQALPRDISNLVVYYNRDCFKKAGLPNPNPNWSWAQFIQTAQKLTVHASENPEAQQFGVSFYRTPPLFWLPWVWSAGGQLFDSKMTQVTLLEPQALAGLQFYTDWIHRYHIAPNREESGGATMSQLFLQKKVAMLISGRWSVPVFRKQAQFDWDVVPLPQGLAGSRVGIDSSGYAMARQTQHPKEAWAWIEFLLSQSAIRQVAQSGLIVPARFDVAQTPLFLNPQERPLHSQAFLDVISSGVPTQTPARWNELSERIGLALEPVWDGQETPQQALKKALPELNQLLATEHRVDE